MSFFVNTMVCGFSLYQILAFFLIYSCLGWCLEVIYAAVSTGQLVNRGFLNGPVCPIYGFGMIIVLFTLSPLADNLLLLYLGGVILPSVLELVGGWALYKLYHTRWWDYSDFPFNIGGYICLEFSLLWGVGTVVVMKAVHPVIAGFVEMVPQMVGFVLMCILYACYAADVVVTAFAASDLARELDALEKVADSMHAVSDAMTELLGTTAMDVDQKMDESRLQLKLAAAEARDNAAKLSPRDAAAALHGRAAPSGTAGRGAAGPQRGDARPHPELQVLWQGPYAPRLPQAAPRRKAPLSGRAAGAPEVRAQTLTLTVAATPNAPDRLLSVRGIFLALHSP